MFNIRSSIITHLPFDDFVIIKNTLKATSAAVHFTQFYHFFIDFSFIIQLYRFIFYNPPSLSFSSIILNYSIHCFANYFFNKLCCFFTNFSLMTLIIV